MCPHLALRHARRATHARLHADTITPVGFTDDKPTEWVIGITRDYRMRTDRRGIMFVPAPFASVHRWTYDTEGALVLARRSRPVHDAALTDLPTGGSTDEPSTG